MSNPFNLVLMTLVYVHVVNSCEKVVSCFLSKEVGEANPGTLVVNEPTASDTQLYNGRPR